MMRSLACMALVGALGAAYLRSAPNLLEEVSAEEQNTGRIQRAILQAQANGTTISHELATLGGEQSVEEIVDESLVASCCVYLSVQSAALCVRMPKDQAEEAYCRPRSKGLSVPNWDDREKNAVVRASLEDTGVEKPRPEYLRYGRTVYPYSADKQFAVYVGPSRQTTIEFPDGEYVLDYESSYSGFEFSKKQLSSELQEQGWVGQESHFTVRAKEPSAIADLYLTTNKRRYSFFLIAHPTLHQPLISFEYPTVRPQPVASSGKPKTSSPTTLKAHGDCEGIRRVTFKKTRYEVEFDSEDERGTPSAYAVLPSGELGPVLDATYDRTTSTLSVGAPEHKFIVAVVGRGGDVARRCTIERGAV